MNLIKEAYMNKKKKKEAYMNMQNNYKNSNTLYKDIK